jgi:hypothetical protein
LAASSSTPAAKVAIDASVAASSPSVLLGPWVSEPERLVF